MGPCSWQAGEAPSKGLFARAQFFHENISLACQKSTTILDLYGPSTAAWVLTLQDLKTCQRASRSLAIRVVQKAAATMVATTAVERNFGELRLTELKHRGNQLGSRVLESTIKLNTQTFTGRRVGSSMDPDILLRSPAESFQRKVQCRASAYAVQVQTIYKEFFGEKATQGRSLLAEGNRLQQEKPKLNVVRASSDTAAGALTIKDEKAKHDAAVRDIVAKSDKQVSLDSVVQAQLEVSQARAASGKRKCSAIVELDEPDEDEGELTVESPLLA